MSKQLKGLNNQFTWPVIGHHNIIDYLQHSILVDKVAQAYLFFGPDHIGKTTVVENFINSLVCESLHLPDTQVPCGQCSCCRQVANKIHPDILWLQREADEKTGKLKKNISIDQIRKLQSRLYLHSFLNSYKIAVISEAESLSQEASNSLLKLLEEPAPKTVIILMASNVSVMPPTIISRSQVLRFLPVADDEIFKYLTSQKVVRKKAKTLTALSFGRPGIAINYLDQPEDLIDYQDKVKEFLAFHRQNLVTRFKAVGDIIGFSDKGQAKEVLNIWSRVFRDLILIKNSNQDSISNLSLTTELEQVAGLYSNKELTKVLRDINLAKRYLASNISPKLILENIILNLSAT